jgi:plastocyanin
MRRIIIGLFLLIGLLVVGCSSQVQVEQPGKEVAMDNSNPREGTLFQVVMENDLFMPTDLVISKGDNVEWANKDLKKRTVTFENGDFDVEVAVGATTKFTFTESGVFRYFDQFEPGIQGSIIVN